MNWVKTRLSVREEKLRTKQREFFAKKKLEKQTHMNQVHQPGSGISLDLLAINLSNRKKPEAGNQPPPKVVKVDLERLNPYRRRVTNVDLGPLSPKKRSIALHPDMSSAKRGVVSDVSSMSWQPPSFLSSQPVPASRSAGRDSQPLLMLQSKVLQQTTPQTENAWEKTKFQQKAHLSLSNCVLSEPETPFIPFSKPGPRVTFNNKTETWSYSCGSSSSEHSSKEKSSSSELPRTHLREVSSPSCSTAIQRRYQKNLFETEDFQEVSGPMRATENWCRMKDCRNEKHSTNALASDLQVLDESPCVGEAYNFHNNGGSRFLRGISAESEREERVLPNTLKSKMFKMGGNLMSLSEDGELNRGCPDLNAERYSGSQSRKLIDLYDDRHVSDRSFGTSVNYATSYEMRRKLDLDGKDLLKCWISRDDDQPSSTQRSYRSEAHYAERRKAEQCLLSESPFSQSSDDNCRRSRVIEIGREEDGWLVKEKSEKEDVLKAKKKIMEVEPDVLLARKHPHHEEKKLQRSPGRMKRWSESGVLDVSSTEQRRRLCTQSLLADDSSARSFVQRAKDSVGSESLSPSWTDDSSSDERSSILSSCPSTKSFIQCRQGHQQRDNCRNPAGGNRPKSRKKLGEERAVPNSWLLFVRGETQGRPTKAPATGSRQLPAAAAAQVITEQSIGVNELSSSENSGKESSDVKSIALASDMRGRAATTESDSDSHKREMVEENGSKSLQMATLTLATTKPATSTLTTTTHDDRSSCSLVTSELGDNNTLRMATAELVDTNCLYNSCQSITHELLDTMGAANVENSDETVHSTAYSIKEQSIRDTRNVAKCVNNLDQTTEGESCIMDSDAVCSTADILYNDPTFSADIEPTPKRYKYFRELVIGAPSSTLSNAYRDTQSRTVNCDTQSRTVNCDTQSRTVNCDTQSRTVNCDTQSTTESPVLMTTSIQTSPLHDVLSSYGHYSVHSAQLVTTGTQTSPLTAPPTANACTSPAISRWTVDAQSSPIFGPSLHPLLHSCTSLNCSEVDVSLSPVFQPVKSSDAQLSPVFQYKTTDTLLSPISSFFSTSAQQSPILAEKNSKSLILRKGFASDMKFLSSSSESTSNLQTLSSISCDHALLPMCAEVKIETVYTAKCSAHVEAVLNPPNKQELHESNICLEVIANEQDDVHRHVENKLECVGVEVMAALDGKPQTTTEEHASRLGCCLTIDETSLRSDVSVRGMVDRFQQNEGEVDLADCSFGCIRPAKQTISCIPIGDLQSKPSDKPIEDAVLEVLDVHVQCSKAISEESSVSSEVDKLCENDSRKLRDSVPSADPDDVKVPDLVPFSSDLEDLPSASVDKKGLHLCDSSGNSSVYSSPMG